MKHVRSIGRDVDCLAGMDDGFLSAKCCFDLSIQHDECFFKVMAMRPRTTAGRDMHINHAEPAFGVVSIDGDGVGIANETDVRQLSFAIGIRGSQGAFEIVGRKGRILCLRFWPAASVREIAPSVPSMLAPATMAPEGSVTVPSTRTPLAHVVCPNAITDQSAMLAEMK